MRVAGTAVASKIRMALAMMSANSLNSLKFYGSGVLMALDLQFPIAVQ
jgi:hypothetical protein